MLSQNFKTIGGKFKELVRFEASPILSLEGRSKTLIAFISKSLFDFAGYFGHETRRRAACSKRAQFSSKTVP